VTKVLAPGRAHVRAGIAAAAKRDGTMFACARRERVTAAQAGVLHGAVRSALHSSHELVTMDDEVLKAPLPAPPRPRATMHGSRALSGSGPARHPWWQSRRARER
jgi:hypothetical protein